MLFNTLMEKKFTRSQAAVAELVSKGLSNKEVANQLNVAEKTVKWHLSNIYKKLNVKSRAQLIVWCLPYMQFNAEEQKGQTCIEAYRAPKLQLLHVKPGNDRPVEVQSSLPVGLGGFNE